MPSVELVISCIAVGSGVSDYTHTTTARLVVDCSEVIYYRVILLVTDGLVIGIAKRLVIV